MLHRPCTLCTLCLASARSRPAEHAVPAQLQLVDHAHVSGCHNLAVLHDVNLVWLDVVQQALQGRKHSQDSSEKGGMYQPVGPHLSTGTPAGVQNKTDQGDQRCAWSSLLFTGNCG